ncbi:MAG TPA: hypothetical protein VKA16_03170 [Burkholderiales bacterium]|nr:hypothetical protein [Burkholderiales bacterium]
MTDKLLTSFKHEGVWWKPDDPDNKIGGTLSYDPTSGCELSLLGQFGFYETFGKTIPDAIPTLHGVLRGGGKLTLIDNLFGGGQLAVPGLTTEIRMPRYALLGALIDSLESFLACKCRFSLTNLEEWLCHRPFGFQYTPADLKNFKLIVRLPDEQVFGLPHVGAKHKANASMRTRLRTHNQ